MTIDESRVTTRGQLPLPASVREKLGLTPGMRVEWHEEGGKIYLQRAHGCTSRQINEAVFSTPPASKSTEDFEQGIRDHVRNKHARP